MTDEAQLARSCDGLTRGDASFGERLAHHEREAMERLFDACFEPIHARAHSLCRTTRAAEALMRDIFVDIREGLPERDADGPLGAWVEGIVADRIRLFRSRRGLSSVGPRRRAPGRRLEGHVLER